MPPSTTLPNGQKIAFIVTAIVLILVLAYIAFLVVFKPTQFGAIQLPLSNVIRSAMVPHELRDVTYVLAPSSGGRLYKDHQSAEERGKFWDLNVDSMVLDMAHAGDHMAEIVFHKDTNMYGVQYDGPAVVSTNTRKQSLSMSPNGMELAFAESTQDPSLASSWTVTVTDASGKETYTAPGFAAYFVDDTHLLRFTEKGIALSNLSNASEQVVMVAQGFNPLMRTAQSADRMLVAWTNPETKQTEVYKMNGASLDLVSTHNVPDGGSIALSSTSLYWLAATKDGSTLWQYPFGKSTFKNLGSSTNASTKLIF